MADPNPLSDSYERYLHQQLNQVSESMQADNKNFRTQVGCLHYLIRQEEEGTKMRSIIQTYLEELGSLIDNQDRISIPRWLTLTTLMHFRWDDTICLEGLDEIKKKIGDMYLISYNLHTQAKTKLDELPDTQIRGLWIMLLVELMNKFERMSEATSLKGFRREVELKLQYTQPNLWKPE